VQAWHLAFYQKPLFDGKFQAWIHGPVNREIYDRFKENKLLYSTVDCDDLLDRNINETNKEIMKNYINLFKEMKNNNYINEYGFNKEEIKCVIKQENKNSFENYNIFTNEDKDDIKYIM
jgi:hypothetical protein